MSHGGLLCCFTIVMLCIAVERQVTVHVGQQATLKCSTTEPVDWWYQQTKNSPAQQICSAGHMVNGFEVDIRYSLRRSTPDDSSLVIDNVTVHNSGFYSCKTIGRGVLRFLQLNVRGKDSTVHRKSKENIEGITFIGITLSNVDRF